LKKNHLRPTQNDKPDVFRPAKGSSKVIIGNGVKLKGEITDADEVQIDGSADITVSADNLIIGSTGNLKGTIQTANADVWGDIDGDLKVSGTLTIQEQGSVSGSVEYQSLQIKLGGKIKGDVKASEKVKKITDAPTFDSSSLQDSVKEKKS
jgi:cytoskeletal protein CcmA (bactofilin family)